MHGKLSNKINKTWVVTGASRKRGKSKRERTEGGVREVRKGERGGHGGWGGDMRERKWEIRVNPSNF